MSVPNSWKAGGITAFLLPALLACSGGHDRPELLGGSEPAAVGLPTGETGVVIMGLSVSRPMIGGVFGTKAEPVQMTWIGYDPHSGKEVPTQKFVSVVSCPDLEVKTMFCPKHFAAWSVPAGAYTLGHVDTGGYDQRESFNVARYRQVTKSETSKGFVSWVNHLYSGDISLRPNAPAFVVAAGTVTYVGDIAFGLNGGKLIEWTYEQDEVAARQFLRGTPLAAKMIFRPWKRVDG